MALTKIKSHSVAVNSLTVANIADNAIDATKIASNSILTRHIDDAQITTDQILDGTIATADIADDAVTEDKLANAINTSIAAKLPLAGGTLTGALTTNGVVNTGTSHNFALNTPNSLRINIDSNNSATDQVFVIGHNQTSVDTNNALMTILESGKVGIGDAAPQDFLEVRGSTLGGITISNATHNYAALSFARSSSATARIYTSEPDALHTSSLHFQTSTAASGPTLVTAMTINQSQKVGIGTTSPQNTLHVNTSSTDSRMQFTNASSGSAYGDGLWVGLDNTQAYLLHRESTPLTFWTSATKRMTIASNGRVSIGTTTANAGLTVANGDIRTTAAAIANDANSFSMSQESSGGTLCARGPNGSTRGTIQLSVNKDNGGDGIVGLFIANDGNPCVGKTSSDINTQGFHIISTGTYSGTVYSGITGSTAGSTYHVRDTTNNAWKFYVTHAGVINATSTSISGLSDERLKENILDLETGLSEVMALKPRRFDWKEGEGSNIKNVAGFIAQEVETVLPDLIEGFMHDELDDAKSVKMGDMIPTLVKAIQEQQTLIESLTARIETLEG